MVVWGEFGRTPTINKDGGRDHWPRVSCALLAGGGMKLARSLARPIVWAERLQNGRFNSGRYSPPFITTSASMLAKVTVPDLSGRPQYLVDNGVQPMRELVKA